MKEIKTESTGTASAGSYEMPLVDNEIKEEDGQTIKEEDYIELDENTFRKMVVSKLMKEEVYNSHAMTVSNKYNGEQVTSKKKEN